MVGCGSVGVGVDVMLTTETVLVPDTDPFVIVIFVVGSIDGVTV